MSDDESMVQTLRDISKHFVIVTLEPMDSQLQLIVQAVASRNTFQPLFPAVRRGTVECCWLLRSTFTF